MCQSLVNDNNIARIFSVVSSLVIGVKLQFWMVRAQNFFKFNTNHNRLRNLLADRNTEKRMTNFKHLTTSQRSGSTVTVQEAKLPLG